SKAALTRLHCGQKSFVYTVTVIVYIPFNKRRAAAACCGTTPLPIAFSCWARDKSGTSVIQPLGSPIIQLANSTFKRGLPFRFSSVGFGAAVPVACSQRLTTGS